MKIREEGRSDSFVAHQRGAGEKRRGTKNPKMGGGGGGGGGRIGRGRGRSQKWRDMGVSWVGDGWRER